MNTTQKLYLAIANMSDKLSGSIRDPTTMELIRESEERHDLAVSNINMNELRNIEVLKPELETY